MRKAFQLGRKLPLTVTRAELLFWFQVHGPDAVAALDDHTSIAVEKHRSGVPIRAGGGWTFTMRYKGADVVSWYPGGTVSLTVDRRETRATKRRMNIAVVPLGWRVFQWEYAWYLWKIGTTDVPETPFRNGMIVAHAYNGSEHNS